MTALGGFLARTLNQINDSRLLVPEHSCLATASDAIPSRTSRQMLNLEGETELYSVDSAHHLTVDGSPR